MQPEAALQLMGAARRLSLSSAALLGLGAGLVFLAPLGSDLGAWPRPTPGYLMGSAALLFTVFVVGAVATWFFLLQAAWAPAGPGYALAHVGLSILLTPLALVGLLWVPLVVAHEVADGSAVARAPLRLSWLDVVAVVGFGLALVFRDDLRFF